MKYIVPATPHADKCMENVETLRGNSAATVSSVDFFPPQFQNFLMTECFKHSTARQRGVLNESDAGFVDWRMDLVGNKALKISA